MKRFRYHLWPVALCLFLLSISAIGMKSQIVIGSLSFAEDCVTECIGSVTKIEAVEGGCISTNAATFHIIVLHVKSSGSYDVCQVNVAAVTDEESGSIIEDRSEVKKRLKAEGWKLVGSSTFTGVNSIPPCYASSGLVGVYKLKNRYIATFIR